MPIDPDCARIGRMQPHKHLHKRRFAGSVLTDQAMDFALVYLKINVLQSLNPGEGLTHTLHLQN
jgi:hypothetical protein